MISKVKSQNKIKNMHRIILMKKKGNMIIFKIKLQKKNKRIN